MQDAVYELVSMGLRYLFVLLLLLMLLRTFGLMRRDGRAWRRTLRQLPDAGLVGELVDLATGRGYPLSREGMIGSGRSCDIRLPGLRRRELEFLFRPGKGLRLMPAHRKIDASLNGERLSSVNEIALHGTVLEIRDVAYRFRLFAGLGLPVRQASQQPLAPSLAKEEMGIEYAAQPLPPSAPPQDEMGMTWQFAPPPATEAQPPETLSEPPAARRRRRGRRDEGSDEE